jgi:hemoglobin/transferrin/lactoferrin receptor protein
MKKTIALFACVCSILGHAQIDQDTTKSIKLDKVIVSSQRFAKQKRKITQQVESISQKEIEFQNFQTTADVLGNSGVLSVQKSQQGGGSPVIRGFEASRILLLVDGIRMNNLIYRGGHLQNSITVDRNMLENVDVLFGPSSTIYGSDALGGAIYLQTKNPKLLSDKYKNAFSGNVLTNYSAVNKGKVGHFDFNYGTNKFASLTSVSYNDFDDLKMGKQKNGKNGYFGERPFNMQTINGVDTQVANDDKYLQKFSGYKQYDFMQKIFYQPNSRTKHNLNLQYSTTNDIPRYDRLTDKNAAGNLRTSVWNYGPQKRLLAAYKFSQEKAILNSDMNLGISYQNVEESRITRGFASTKLNSRIENVTVFGLTTDFKTKIGKGDLIYGADVYYDDLKSTANQKNTTTGVIVPLDTRYPDGKNNSLKAEAFVAYSNDISKTASVNASFRGGYNALKSEIKTNFLNLPFTLVEQKNFTYSGAVGIVNNASKNTKIAFNLASGYRAPNVDNLAKIFESAPGILIVPNKDLKPEKTVTADLSITFWNGSRFQFENTFFITKIYDPILTDKFTFNGQTSVIYEGVNSQVYANQNQGTGDIFGYFACIKGYISKSVLFYGTFNFTDGKARNDAGSFPLDHIAPIYGKTGLKYESKKVNIDLYMLYNGNKSLAKYSPSGEDNLQYAPVNGMPAWETYNLKTSFSVFKELTIFSGVENILDTQYRTFASGINAGGRNFYLGGKYSF